MTKRKKKKKKNNFYCLNDSWKNEKNWLWLDLGPIYMRSSRFVNNMDKRGKRGGREDLSFDGGKKLILWKEDNAFPSVSPQPWSQRGEDKKMRWSKDENKRTGLFLARERKGSKKVTPYKYFVASKPSKLFFPSPVGRIVVREKDEPLHTTWCRKLPKLTKRTRKKADRGMERVKSMSF